MLTSSIAALQYALALAAPPVLSLAVQCALSFSFLFAAGGSVAPVHVTCVCVCAQKAQSYTPRGCTSHPPPAFLFPFSLLPTLAPCTLLALLLCGLPRCACGCLVSCWPPPVCADWTLTQSHSQLPSPPTLASLTSFAALWHRTGIRTASLFFFFFCCCCCCCCCGTALHKARCARLRIAPASCPPNPSIITCPTNVLFAGFGPSVFVCLCLGIYLGTGMQRHRITAHITVNSTRAASG
ncbi:hypothetical protein PTNB73_08862 [Pyrenophora teres f. teres]|nr:hypothetical protein PTNB73_08862 [Pyrenophora teres f. teres]